MLKKKNFLTVLCTLATVVSAGAGVAYLNSTVKANDTKVVYAKAIEYKELSFKGETVSAEVRVSNTVLANNMEYKCSVFCDNMYEEAKTEAVYNPTTHHVAQHILKECYVVDENGKVREDSVRYSPDLSNLNVGKYYVRLTLQYFVRPGSEDLFDGSTIVPNEAVDDIFKTEVVNWYFEVTPADVNDNLLLQELQFKLYPELDFNSEEDYSISYEELTSKTLKMDYTGVNRLPNIAIQYGERKLWNQNILGSGIYKTVGDDKSGTVYGILPPEKVSDIKDADDFFATYVDYLILDKNGKRLDETCIDVGTYDFKLQFIGNFTGTIDGLKLEIVARSNNNEDYRRNVSYDSAYDTYSYTGKAIDVQEKTSWLVDQYELAGVCEGMTENRLVSYSAPTQIQWKANDEGTFTTVSEVKNAGIYEVTYKVNNNFDCYDGVTVDENGFYKRTITVDPSYLTVGVQTKNIEYGDDLTKAFIFYANGLASTDSFDDVMQVKKIGFYNDETGEYDYLIEGKNGVLVWKDETAEILPGNYDIEIVTSVKDGVTNYTTGGTAYGYLKVNKKTVQIHWAEKEFTYNGEDQTEELAKTYYVNAKGEQVLMQVCVSNTFVAAGDYRVNVLFAGNEGEDELYTLPTKTTKTYTIKKAVYDMSGITFADKQFDLSDANFETNIAGADKIVGDLPLEDPYMDTEKTVTVSYEGEILPVKGLYTITAKFATESENYTFANDTMVAKIMVGNKSEQVSVNTYEKEEQIAKVESIEGILNVLYSLKVEKHDVKDASKVLANSKDTKWTEKVIEVYDVSLVDEDMVEHQPDGTLKVTLTVPEKIGGGNFRLFHIHDGVATEVDYNMVNGKAEFTTDSLSEFVFVYKYTSMVWLIVLLAIFIVGLIVLSVLQLRKNIKKNGGFFRKSTLMSAGPVMIISGQIPAITVLAIVVGILAVLNLLYFGYNKGWFNKKPVKVGASEDNKEIAVAEEKKAVPEKKTEEKKAVSEKKVAEAPVQKTEEEPAQKTEAPAQEPVALSFSESVKRMENIDTKAKVRKADIVNYLEKTFGVNIKCNTRPNYVKGTKLPCADTHYIMVNGKDVCFAYVYELEGDKTLILVKANEGVATKWKSSHENIVKSNFPKSKKNDWYSVAVDSSFTKKQVFEMLNEVASDWMGTEPVKEEPEEEKWVKEAQAVAQSSEEEFVDDAEGETVIGVFFKNRKQKIYYFQYNGVDFAKGEVAEYLAEEGDMRKVVVYIPKIVRETSKLHLPLKTLVKIGK